MNSEDIKNRRLTNRESQALRGIAARQAAGDDSRINLKGIPRLTDRQLGSYGAIPRRQTAEEGSQRSSG